MFIALKYYVYVINYRALQIWTFFCANKMAPGVSEGIFRAENLPSRYVFEKMGVETPKISHFRIFLKNCRLLNTDALEPSLLY